MNSKRLLMKLGTRQLDQSAVPDDEYRFMGEISNPILDSYNSHMTESTLENFVADSKSRVSLQADHSQEIARTLGYSIEGERDGDAVITTFSMLRDSETTPSHLSLNEHIRRVEKGFYNDLSVGFHGGREICDICPGDREVWGWTPDGANCEHWPGQRYDGTVATYRIDGAHLGEVSIVTAGANAQTQILQRSKDPTIDGNLIKFKKDGSTHKRSGDGDPPPVDDAHKAMLMKDGEFYRNSIIETALQEGVRAEGKEFDNDKWKERLESWDAKAILDQIAVWKRLGDAQWKGNGGRMTHDGTNPYAHNETNGLFYPAHLVS